MIVTIWRTNPKFRQILLLKKMFKFIFFNPQQISEFVDMNSC